MRLKDAASCSFTSFNSDLKERTFKELGFLPSAVRVIRATRPSKLSQRGFFGSVVYAHGSLPVR